MKHSGKQIKYDRLKSVQKKAQESFHAALCLPVYRKLVAQTTELITPTIEESLNKYVNQPGKPGYNAIATPYLNDLGAKKVAALATICTVNNFHRSISFQSLAVKIGNSLATEWILSQEDKTLVDQINKYRYGNVSNNRRLGYLRKQLSELSTRGLMKIDTQTRAAMGSLILGIICRTPLVETCTEGTKGLRLIFASPEVLTHLEESIDNFATAHPVLLPVFSPNRPQLSKLIRPQKGTNYPLSYIKDTNTDIFKAAESLNNVGWRVNKQQLEFIKECAKATYSIMGLPYAFVGEFPRYAEDNTEEERKKIRRARARMYAERNKNRTRRARLLSCLSFLPQYCERPCFFDTEADFRGRLYTTSDLVSYQGPDWLRSLWEFSEGVPVENDEHLRWLYIHAANCYGYSRSSFDFRASFIDDKIEQVRRAAKDPWNNVEFLELAEDPFRFLAACREIDNVLTHGWGTLSYLPVQIDASSQGIQILSTLCNDTELMEASNVLGNEPRDIYMEFANTMNDICYDSPDPACSYFRNNPIPRKLAKAVLMLLSYGGTRHAVREAVDNLDWRPPFRARVWLTTELWNTAHDILHQPLKLQQGLSQAVSEHHAWHSGANNYSWSAPSGVHVSQVYMVDKRVRIKDVVGNSIHSYKVQTNKHDPTKSARAFPPNFVHSIDASILTKAIVQAKNYNIQSFMAIHDCVGIHAAHASTMSKVLGSAFLNVIRSDEVKVFNKVYLDRGVRGPIMASTDTAAEVVLSPYLFS